MTNPALVSSSVHPPSAFYRNVFGCNVEYLQERIKKKRLKNRAPVWNSRPACRSTSERQTSETKVQIYNNYGNVNNLTVPSILRNRAAYDDVELC